MYTVQRRFVHNNERNFIILMVYRLGWKMLFSNQNFLYMENQGNYRQSVEVEVEMAMAMPLLLIRKTIKKLRFNIAKI